MTPRPIHFLLQHPALAFAAGAGLTWAYWWGGLAKLFDLQGALAEARQFGLEPVGLVVAATIAVELVASLLLIANRWAWLAAGALGVFTALATLVAHRF